MRRFLILTTMMLFVLLFLVACGQEETALPTRAALAEVAAPDVVVTNAPTVSAIVSEVEDEGEGAERPLLPHIANALAEENTSAIAPAMLDIFGETTFSLETTLPTEVPDVHVWQQVPVPLDASRAQEIAERWQIDGPLYQFATPYDDAAVGDLVGEQAAPLSLALSEFHVFDGTRSLVITEGAAYFSDATVPFDYETPRSFAENAPMAEVALQTMGLLDFPYSLTEGWGHEVGVNRELDGLPINYPEISAGVNENGRLAFAAYQPFDHLTDMGAYPIISADVAWQQIQDGIDPTVLYAIASAEVDNSPHSVALGFQYWPREHQTGQEVHLYAYPTVFLPVDESLPPRIHALNYHVETDEATRQALADQLGVNVHFWGMLDAETNALMLTDWEPMPDLNPLIKNGTVQRQGDQTILNDQSGGTFILPDAPADLADGSAVNVFAWAAREAGLAYPVLDWEGIDMQIEDASGESMAMPEVLSPNSPAYAQIAISEVDLSYHLYAADRMTGENGRYQQLSWLIPVWQFTGLADNGDTITFTVQATK